MPKYSVIIPAYQCERTIEATVRSVVTSGLTDLEVVIVDDGSTDNTAAICHELCASFPFIRYFRQPNSGVSAARNRGIECSNGVFVLFVDSDDALVPLEPKQLEAYLTDEVDVLIFGMEFQYWKNGICRRKDTLNCDRLLKLSTGEIGTEFSELFYCNYFSSSCNRIIRRSMLLEHNIRFDTRLINYEDLEFSVRVAAYSRNTVAVPDVHYIYYLTAGQDRTVERVKRIPNIVAAVDPVADAMFLLNRRIREVTGTDCQPLLEIALQVYMDMFICKMKTATLQQVRQQCLYFKVSENLKHCAAYFSKMSGVARSVLMWIDRDDAARIWLYFRYRNLRNRSVRCVKSLIGKY